MDDPDIPTPQSVAEVEDLIKRLYEPGNPKLIFKIQQELQKLQRSSEGWLLADTLLSSNDVNVRFFGALTFTVKLNSDWETLDSDGAESLLMRLLTRIIELVSKNESAMIVRKLCSALVTFFLRPVANWTKCIHHLACCFYKGEAVTQDTVSQFPEISLLISSLAPSRFLTMLWFTTSLSEEAQKTEINSQEA